MPYDPDLEKAVALCKSDEPQPLKKHEQYERLKVFSNRQRLPTESPEQAFTRFITKTPEGQVLYKAFTKAKGASVATGHNAGAEGDPKRQTGNDADGDIDGPPADGETEHMRALRILAATLQAKNPTMSKQQALAKVIQTPEGARVALLERNARLSKAVRMQG